MTRSILTYGLISGLASIAGIIVSMKLIPGHGDASMVVGYLIMLVALSAILVAVKQHRDNALGGVIGFLPALGMGLAIAAVATVAYVLVWEAYLAITGYDFVADLTRQTLAEKHAAGASPAEIAKVTAELDEMHRTYSNPVIRMGMTSMELFPVGLLVALVTAALVRNPRFLPAKVRG